MSNLRISSLLAVVLSTTAYSAEEEYRSTEYDTEDYTFESRRYDDGRRRTCTTTKLDEYSFTTCKEN